MKIIYSSSWALVKGVQVMQVDNLNAVGMNFSGLPSNLFMAQWREGRGELETTDAPGLRTIFTDVTPYVSYFQQFMTILNVLGQLTLAQAQQIQNNLITTLFDDKRQATYAFTPAGGASANWSASDTDVAAMSLEAIPFISGSGTSGVNTLVSQINAMIDQINNNIVNPGTHNSGQAGSLAATHNANANNSTVLNNVLNGSAFPNLASRTLAITGGGGTATTAATPGLGAPGATVTTGASFATSGAGFNDFTNIAHIGGAGAGPANIPWSPIGATAPIMLTMTDLTNLMTGISTRRQSLLNTRYTKQAAINALATIAAVIAFDVTAGW